MNFVRNKHLKYISDKANISNLRNINLVKAKILKNTHNCDKSRALQKHARMLQKIFITVSEANFRRMKGSKYKTSNSYLVLLSKIYNQAKIGLNI